MWPGGIVRVQHLHTVEEGTPDSGYRQWPPGPPQGRMRACRWGQSLISGCKTQIVNKVKIVYLIICVTIYLFQQENILI
jgi:hypothetical protein